MPAIVQIVTEHYSLKSITNAVNLNNIVSYINELKDSIK
jgi:4-hydroxy-L-threonine phosphate dehydrogenase PdxA